MTQQPALFDRAFSRIFARELAQAGSQDSTESAALKLFWRPPTNAPAVSRLQPAQSEPLSRYQSDFQASHLQPFSAICAVGCGDSNASASVKGATIERTASQTLCLHAQEIRVLGRGAYGLAVAAVNWLDGRQYAVKKIRLQQQVPNEFSRILREVSTLARLQHTNIVRYFQVRPQLS